MISPQFITDFGDSAVAATLAIVLAAAFLATRNNAAALAMLLAFAIASFLIIVAKIAFYGCWFTPVASLRSPSGHAAISFAVYGTCVLILAASLKAIYRFALYLLAGAFIAMISVTRVTLGYHSMAEVLFGLAAGALTCAIVWALCLRRKPAMINHVLFVTITLIAIFMVHGIRLPAEAFIDSLAARLAHGCVRKS